MSPTRRQLLQALGLGALCSLVGRTPRASAGDPVIPARVVFFVTPHGHVPKAWTLPVPGPTTELARRRLSDLTPADFSTVLRPLFPFREKILAIEGLSHSSVLADVAEVMRSGGDLNSHSISVAGLLTGVRAQQRGGAPCSGGARSIDQEIAAGTASAGRFASRVYGADYMPNATVAPFSFLGPGQASPIVADPAVAFADLVGSAVPGGPTGSREEVIASMRPSVLDSVAREYEALAPKLDAEGRVRLEEHRNLVRELEATLAAPKPKCDVGVDRSGHTVTQFMRLVKMAFACDLTRVVTYVAPVPQPSEIGAPDDTTVHGYAHQSIEGDTACGQTYSPVAERALVDLGVWYAQHFAFLLSELDSVVEGSGTVLDHTAVVWLTELATPTHQMHDVLTVVAGGCKGFFRTGEYVRYPRTFANPVKGRPPTGPAHHRLFSSLLEAMGKPGQTFGMQEATGNDGSTIPMRGPLTELHAKG
jgi:hypothetical protein